MKNILIFEPDESGHHSGYLFHLITNFVANDYSYKLIVVVNPDFFKKHPQIIEKTHAERVQWVQFTDLEFEEWKEPKSVFKRANQEWGLFCQYAREYQATYGFFMYIDYLQLAILTQEPPPCPVSGILFRPTVVNYAPVSWKEKVNFWRKNLLLRLFIKTTKLDSLFSLDTFAAKYMTENWHTTKVIPLPDPVKVYPTTATTTTLKQRLGIENTRQVFLLFGFMDSRKGIADVMDAIANMPRELSKKGCLLVIGNWEENEKKRFQDKLKTIVQVSDFQIIVNNSFVVDEDIQPYFEVSDYVLTLYQKHIGMSAIMVRAAAAQKPLVAYNFGLMGTIIATNELGIVIKNNDEIQPTIARLLSENPKVGNTAKMKAFAELNRAENFAKTILDKFEKMI